MPWQVNITHTMGVDVIDKTAEGGVETLGDDPLTQNHRNDENISITGEHAVCA